MTTTQTLHPDQATTGSTIPTGQTRAAGEVGRLRAEAVRLRAEAARIRAIADRLGHALWVVGAMALIFTMVTVTQFAMKHQVSGWIAWLLDPMVSLALLVVLVGDAVLARHGQRMGGWSTVLKLGAGSATWAMNVWESVATRDPAGIVLHSVAPALVIGLAEVTPRLRVAFAELADRLDARAGDLDARADALEHAAATAAAATAATAAATTAATAAAATAATSAVAVRSEPRPIAATVQGPTRTENQTDARTESRTEPRSVARTVARTEPRTVAGSGARTDARTDAEATGPGERTERRSAAELEVMVRAAIADGTLPAAPSGTAIQRMFGGGKSPAMSVAARLAEQADPSTEADQGDQVDQVDGSRLVQLRPHAPVAEAVAS
jgi:hypothetical protein